MVLSDSNRQRDSSGIRGGSNGAATILFLHERDSDVSTSKSVCDWQGSGH